MLKKLATVFLAAAFGLAIYSPVASACPGMDDTTIAKKEKKQKDTKVANKAKAKDKAKSKTKKKTADKKSKEGKKVSRR